MAMSPELLHCTSEVWSPQDANPLSHGRQLIVVLQCESPLAGVPLDVVA